MAYKRTNKRKSIRKFVKKSFQRKKYIGKPRRSLTLGFPRSKIVKLRYCDQIAIDVGVSGVASTYVFSANSLYDPNVTGIGHQPGCFDTYASIYNHYTVLGAKITCKFFSQTASDNYEAVVGIKLDDDATITPATAITDLIEQPNNLFKWKVLRTNALASMSSVTVTHYYSAKKFFGIKDVKDNGLQLGALVTSSPTEAACFILAVGAATADLDLPNVQCLVTIDYIAEFSELKDQTRS